MVMKKEKPTGFSELIYKMVEEKIGLIYKKKKIRIFARKVKGFDFFRGLMFCRRENADVLLFDFKNKTDLKIHSCFVFFPFLAVWLDDENKIIQKQIVVPWKVSVSPKRNFKKLIEIPFNKKYYKILKFLDGS